MKSCVRRDNKIVDSRSIETITALDDPKLRRLELTCLVSNRQGALSDQQRRLRETEAEIGRYETLLHQERCRELGVGYVHQAANIDSCCLSDDEDDTLVKDVSSSKPTADCSKPSSSMRSVDNESRVSLNEMSTFRNRQLMASKVQAGVDGSFSSAAQFDTSKEPKTRVIDEVDEVSVHGKRFEHQVEQLHLEINSERNVGDELTAEIERVVESVEECQQTLVRKTSQLFELFSVINSISDLQFDQGQRYRMQTGLQYAIDKFGSFLTAPSSASDRQQTSCSLPRVCSTPGNPVLNDEHRGQYTTASSSCRSDLCPIQAGKRLSVPESNHVPSVNTDRSLNCQGHSYCMDWLQCNAVGQWMHKALNAGGSDDSDTGIGSLQEESSQDSAADLIVFTGMMTLV